MYETYGTIFQDGKPQTCEASTSKPRIHAALTFILRNCLMLSRCHCVRLGRGIRRIGRSEVDCSSILFWWFPNDHCNLMIHQHHSSSLDISQIIGTAYKQAGIIQTIQYPKQVYTMSKIHNINNQTCLDYDDFAPPESTTVSDENLNDADDDDVEGAASASDTVTDTA